jgi:ornithine carbamoyltransferase
VGAKLGMDVRIGAPQELWPTEDHVTMCHEFAATSGARLTVTDDPLKAVSGVDFIYTDVWVSMGEPVETWGDRIELLLPFQVNSELMALAGNPRVKFMHCLPAFHNSETVVGAKIAAQYPQLSNGIEVTEDVFESPANIAFEQAENRMHTIKAVLVAALS